MTPEVKGYLLIAAIKLLAAFTLLMLAVAFTTWVERRGAAFIQNRLGPNRVGPQGLLQPIADGIKNFIKEETIPEQADVLVFLLAPALSFMTAFLLFAVVPFAAPLPISFDFSLPILGRFVHDGVVPMVVADLPIGVLFIIAVSSLGVFGIVLAGWSQGNKYALLGGLRSSSQMISYEISLGMSLIAVLLLAGDVTLGQVIRAQQGSIWFVVPLTLGFLMFAVSALAENNRLPFDLPEAESELIAGYHTEYSSMKFAIFFMSEYAAVITMSALMVTLFWGGWDIPFTHWDDADPTLLKTVITFFVFGAKVSAFVFWYVWVRWTLPRFRFDQLMALGWKVMLPISIGYIMLVAATAWVLDAVGVAFGPVYALIIGAVNLLALAVVFLVLDSDRLVFGVGARVQRRA